jgi:hypothetical protein
VDALHRYAYTHREEIAAGMNTQLQQEFLKMGFVITDFRIEGTDFDEEIFYIKIIFCTHYIDKKCLVIIDAIAIVTIGKQRNRKFIFWIIILNR